MTKIEPVSVATSVPGVFAFIQPPESFSPTDASDEDLVRYGFPLRPADPIRRAQWDQRVSRVNRIIPTFEITNITRSPKPKAASQSDETKHRGIEPCGTNWSGVVIVDHVNTPFANWGDQVVGRWNVPNVGCPPGAIGPHYCSQWVGIDGYGGNELFQAGTEVDINCPGGPSCFAWYQWLPMMNFAVSISNFPLSPGDNVDVMVGPFLGDISQGFLAVTNFSQGNASFNLHIVPSPGTSLIGYSAEWIVERPTINGQFANLADYGQMLMENCSALNYLGKNGPVDVYVPKSAPTGTITNLTMLDNICQPESVPTVVDGPPAPPGATIPNVSIRFNFV